jgi:hypothetical protein
MSSPSLPVGFRSVLPLLFFLFLAGLSVHAASAPSPVTVDDPVSTYALCLLAVDIDSDDVECSGSHTGNAVAVASGGTPPYSYVWSTGATTDTLSAVAAGSYSVLVTDAAGCRAEAGITITEPPPLLVEITSDNVECFGDESGNAAAIPSGGTAPYTFFWSTGATGASIAGVPAGDYGVTVTDANGCSAYASVTITQPPAFAVEITSDNVECFGSASGNATATPWGGTGPYTFLWSNGATGPALSNIPAGEYSVTVTDANGCPASASVTITEPRSPLGVAIESDDVECFGGATGNAFGAVWGGTAPYTLSWSNGSHELSLVGVAAGEYSLTVTDANGCPAQASVTITQPAPLGVEITSDGVECFGDASGNATAIPSGGTAPYTFFWSNGATGASIAGVPGGWYGVTVTDANGCSANASVTITEPPPFAVEITSDNVECFGSASGNATATPWGGTGPYTFLWSNGATGPALSNIPAGEYSVTVTDANGCPASASVTITEPRSPLGVAIESDDVECFGGATGNAFGAVWGGTAPYTLSWSNGSHELSLVGVAAGEYSLTVTDANGCSAQASVTITQPAPLGVEITSDGVECFGGASGNATAIPSGGAGPYTFLWSNGATGPSLIGVPAGEYGVTVTDGNGCPAFASVTITQPAPLNVEITSDNVECFGSATGNATVTPSGGAGPYTFLWSNGATGPSLTGVPAGEYSVTVTDANGCPASASVTIGEPPPLAVEISSDGVECFGGATGNATVTPSGGAGPYTFLWSNGATGPSLAGVPAGEYGVTVTDANGCPAFASVTITQPGPLGLEITSDSVECHGGSSGNATVIASGGVGPYTFLWSNGATGPSLIGVPAGEYGVTVTDGNGCPASASVTITQPPPLAVEITSDSVECLGGESGSATAIASGGIGPYTFLWSTGATGTKLTNVPAGEYAVTVTDANGCPAFASVTITQPPPLAVEVSSDSVECFGGASGNATVTPSGGTGPYTFAWSNGATGATLSNVPAGEYSVTVTDANGCPAFASVTITQPPPLAVEISSDNIECFGGENGNATANASGGAGPYTFLWSNGATGPTLNNVPAGEYGVTATDANGCTASASVTLTQPPALSVEATSVDVTCYGGTNGSIDLTVTGGTGPYTYLWSPGGAVIPDLAGLGAAVYTVTVTDSAGCRKSLAVTIHQPPADVITLPAAPYSVQYSDPIELSATTAPATTGAIVYVIRQGADIRETLPAVNVVGGIAGAFAYQVLLPAGSYSIDARFKSSAGCESVTTTTLTVAAEEATISPAAENPGAVEIDGTTASFVLAFTVRETLPEPSGDPPDARAGNINLAVAGVQLLAVGGSPDVTESCVAGPVVSGFEYVARTYSCTFTDIPIDAYEVKATVSGGYYADTLIDALTVYDPAAGFLTGGGMFVFPESDDRVSFGLVYRFTGKGKDTPRGNLLVIRHMENGDTCRAKSNGMGAPAVWENTAAFSGKGNFVCTRPDGTTYDSAGNVAITGWVEDGGGEDRFWVNIPGTVLAMPKPAAANAVLLTGGNIQVPQRSRK